MGSFTLDEAVPLEALTPAALLPRLPRCATSTPSPSPRSSPPRSGWARCSPPRCSAWSAPAPGRCSTLPVRSWRCTNATRRHGQARRRGGGRVGSGRWDDGLGDPHLRVPGLGAAHGRGGRALRDRCACRSCAGTTSVWSTALHRCRRGSPSIPPSPTSTTRGSTTRRCRAAMSSSPSMRPSGWGSRAGWCRATGCCRARWSTTCSVPALRRCASRSGSSTSASRSVSRSNSCGTCRAAWTTAPSPSGPRSRLAPSTSPSSTTPTHRRAGRWPQRRSTNCGDSDLICTRSCSG